MLVYDALGREVETLVNEKQSSGVYEVTFNGSNLSSGIYFYKLITDEYSETKKMLLIK
ncbi:MAG: T9SS type A sorting domain-containing protein [Ignavibacteriae bacterium]|nr:T9SS type A sorting domain-containing protein [Ignavibacteriota bacterium]